MLALVCMGTNAEGWYATKTPYQPQQDAASYEKAPAGFAPMFTELVARHGSRGLSSAKDDVMLYALWQLAQSEGALTPLGQQLGPDLMAMMKANALLGCGVADISKPGYGNLTVRGLREHRQLAERLLQRQGALFAAALKDGRKLVVQTSGVDRAIDSSRSFTRSLAERLPALQPLIVPAPALTGYPADKAVAQPEGVNRFQLYFHRLKADTDLVTDNSDPNYAVYQDSLAIQRYQKSAEAKDAVEASRKDPALKAAARAVVVQLFSPEFVERIDSGKLSLSLGSFAFNSEDQRCSGTAGSGGKRKVDDTLEVAQALYGLYQIAPAFETTLEAAFSRYLQPEQARLLAAASDAEDFYLSGPSTVASAKVTSRMANGLLQDFFREVDVVAQGKMDHAAKLRFAHAEIIMPFATRLGLAGVDAPVAEGQRYRYESNPWRGQTVSPMAANIQWDIWRNPQGQLLVKMLYNEKETAFKPACDSARQAQGSFFYDYSKLKACYADTLAETVAR
ncbi:histidine-type phosphatase [Leeia aquatica]|uniref:histidine-type phosphatase n=1 Tax=Leeia aquatica TaxID=2725557 RepID=UPI0019817BFA|nr:histidine-type phosphatase [Leeia aquatica]